MGNSMSLLKSRRMSGKKIKIKKLNPDGTASAQRTVMRASVKMSNDIQSLIDEFHTDTSAFKNDVKARAHQQSRGKMGQTMGDFGSMSQAAAQTHLDITSAQAGEPSSAQLSTYK